MSVESRISGFLKLHPEIYFLDPSCPTDISRYLKGRALLDPAGTEEVTEAVRAGDGNMNCTVRIRTSKGRSLILKQSRPWVEKYPQFEAPWDRARVEIEFYRWISPYAGLRGRMPALIQGDADARMLILEDLGTDGDYASVYRTGGLEDSVLSVLVEYLVELHDSCEVTVGDPKALRNRGMRELNYAHIFKIPLERENGLDLDQISPGLSRAAGDWRDDSRLVAAVTEVGRQWYLRDGKCLVHGDFFLGSIVRTQGGPKVIDAEFAFHGHAEWDLGVFMAHLILAGCSPVQVAAMLSRYQGLSRGSRLDENAIHAIAGVEIMRRLIGYAQLPLGWTAEERIRLLKLARRLILGAEL